MGRFETTQPSRTTAAANAANWLGEHGDHLFRFAMVRVGDAEAAEDLVQDTLLAALAGQGSFEGRSMVRTWLIGILKRKIADHRRRTLGRPQEKQAAGFPSDEALAQWVEMQFNRRGIWKSVVGRWGPDPRTDAERDELRQALEDCLDKLPPRAAEVFLLTERGECSADRISKIHGLSTTNIGVILFRARVALRHCLEINWFGHKQGGSS